MLHLEKLVNPILKKQHVEKAGLRHTQLSWVQDLQVFLGIKNSQQV